MSDFRIEIKENGLSLEIRARASAARGLTPEEAKRIARAAAAGMKSRMPYRSGNLKRSVKTKTDVAFGGRSTLGTFLPGREWESKVTVHAPYAEDVDQGTGLYGPKKKAITPANGNVMMIDKEPNPVRMDVDRRGSPINRYRPRNGPVFTKYVRGQKPKNFHNAGYAAARMEAYRAEARWADRVAGD